MHDALRSYGGVWRGMGRGGGRIHDASRLEVGGGRGPRGTTY